MADRGAAPRIRQRPLPPGSCVLRPAPAAALIALAYVLSLPVAAVLAGGDRWPLRVAGAFVLSGLALRPVARQLLLRGPGAVRRLHWDDAGAFGIDLAGGYSDRVALQPASLGSTRFLWLVLRGRRRYHMFLDRAATDPAEFAALRRCLLARRSTPDALG